MRDSERYVFVVKRTAVPQKNANYTEKTYRVSIKITLTHLTKDETR